MKLELYNVLDYRTGKKLATRPGPEWAEKWFGYPWWVLHRADYQKILVEEAQKLGAKLKLNSDVVDVACGEQRPYATLATGERLEADVIVGADGMPDLSRNASSCLLL